jgi:hypothetical protein
VRAGMTNSIAIGLAIVILALLALDWQLAGFDNSLFLARKFNELLEWIAFWR